MPILRLTDGQKRLLLSLHGVRRHKRLLLEEARWQAGWPRRLLGSVELSAILAEPRTGTGHSSILRTPSPDRVPVPALFATGFPCSKQQISESAKEDDLVCR